MSLKKSLLKLRFKVAHEVTVIGEDWYYSYSMKKWMLYTQRPGDTWSTMKWCRTKYNALKQCRALDFKCGPLTKIQIATYYFKGKRLKIKYHIYPRQKKFTEEEIYNTELEQTFKTTEYDRIGHPSDAVWFERDAELMEINTLWKEIYKDEESSR